MFRINEGHTDTAITSDRSGIPAATLNAGLDPAPARDLLVATCATDDGKAGHEDDARLCLPRIGGRMFSRARCASQRETRCSPRVCSGDVSSGSWGS